MASTQPEKKRKLLITSALPYANGDIHLGHLVEVIQTDIFVRFQKMRGHEAVYVCADDTHGTPIELTALKRGITPEQLIGEAWNSHARDYSRFAIDFDIFYSTNSEENRAYAELIYQRLREAELIVEKQIEQFYCEHDKRFLPDRFIVGACPQCGAQEQYGDVCETCGATYEPTELREPRCIICRNKPVIKQSVHFFVQLAKREQFLRDYVGKSGSLQDDMKNFVMGWIDQGLREWCISRDGPYFGFSIPGAENKFFYVWLDAPIGYISSTARWCADHGRTVEEFWNKDADAEVIHFIGKDIVYFHALFWPVMLDSAQFALPARIFVHGFLTVQGEKMSKTRGTFILARDYYEKVAHPSACEYLRFYYGAKLSSHTGDIDLNTEEFVNRVNTTLVNTIGNLHHRTFVFLDRYFDSRLPDVAWDVSIANETALRGEEIALHFEKVEYKAIIEKVHILGMLGNKYYQDSKPWELIKTDKNAAGAVMVTCANLIKALAVFLKPFVPDIVARIETQFGRSFVWEDCAFSARDMKLGRTEKLVSPLDISAFADLLGQTAPEGKPGAEEQSSGDQIAFEDFSRVKLRVGVVRAAETVRKAKKLLRLEVDDGERVRQIVAGIAQHYEPGRLIGKQVVFVANLKPAKLMGLVSEGMVLAAQSGDTLSLIAPDAAMQNGAQVS